MNVIRRIVSKKSEFDSDSNVCNPGDSKAIKSTRYIPTLDITTNPKNLIIISL